LCRRSSTNLTQGGSGKTTVKYMKAKMSCNIYTGQRTKYLACVMSHLTQQIVCVRRQLQVEPLSSLGPSFFAGLIALLWHKKASTWIIARDRISPNRISAFFFDSNARILRPPRSRCHKWSCLFSMHILPQCSLMVDLVFFCNLPPLQYV